MDTRLPPAEASIDERVARTLIAEQHPGLTDRKLTLVDEGWDNVTFRVGRDYALRMPRRQAAVPLLLNERRWLPLLAARLPVATSEPVLDGVASEDFPWPWCIVRWVHGVTAAAARLRDDQAPLLADTLRALHRPAPVDAPYNALRAVPLGERSDVVVERIRRLGLDELGRKWARALESPVSDDRVWVHGDLHPRNVVVRRGALAGIIDWGDLSAGDPATDVACAWTLFDTHSGRRAFLEAYAPSGALEARAMGWAVFFATALLDSGELRHIQLGDAIARRLSEV